MLPESVRVMMLVVECFERLRIPYLIGGSVASAWHGVARSTLDTDIVAEIGLDQVDDVHAALKGEFYSSDDMMRDAIRQRSSFNLIHLATMFKVDVFIRKDRPFDQSQFERKAERIVAADPEQRAFLSTAEDTVLAKLEWYRLGGQVSDRQWRDIVGVLKVQAGRLDLDYLARWAQALDVAELLQRALKESGA